MSAKSILAAGVAALLGALVWGGIAAATGYEVGYVAWGIGFVVGASAKGFGGIGKTAGVVAAVLALGSIFMGKMLAVHFSAPAEIRKMFDATLTREVYGEQARDADDYAGVTSDEDCAKFMVDHEYTEAESVAEVTKEEIADFRNGEGQQLTRFREEKPKYEPWRKETSDRGVDEIMKQLPLAELVVQDLGLFDIIFALLGIGTAYKLASSTGA